MDIILGIITGLIVLAFLVTIHEGGHALAAIKNKVVVEEFAIGFPPTAWSKKLKNKVLFKINWLPLGGYVKLQGEHDAANNPGDYGHASLWQKTQILFAGVLMNFLFAVLVMTVLAWTGLPKVIDNQFYLQHDAKITNSKVFANYIVKDSPADKVGIKLDDKIISIAGQEIHSPDQVKKITSDNYGKQVGVNVLRGNQTLHKTVKLNDQETAKDQGSLGLVPVQTSKITTTWSAPIVGFGTVVQFSKITLEGVGKLFVQFFGGLVQRINIFNPKAQESGAQKIAASGEMVAGPIGILGVMFPALISGDLTDFAFFVAIISLTLAVMNILPIPALDGGRFIVTIIFRLFRKPLTKQTEERIHSYGVIFLLGLTLLITISDVGKIF